MKATKQIADDCGMDEPRLKILKRVLDDTLGGSGMELELQEIIGDLYRRIEHLERNPIESLVESINCGEVRISDVAEPLALTQVPRARMDAIIELANESDLVDNDGGVEIDNNTAIVSEGDANGAYVQAWVWVSFSGTKLDKEPGDGQ